MDKHFPRSCTWEKPSPGVQHSWNLPSWGRALWRGTWGVTRSMWVSTVPLLQQSKAAGGWVGCTTSRHTSHHPIPLSHCQATPAVLCSVLVPSIQKGVGKLERVQRTATKMNKILRGCHVDKVWENWVCPVSRKEGLGLTLSLHSIV